MKNKKMSTEKLSFTKIKDKLSRSELRSIMAGTGGCGCPSHQICCSCSSSSPICVAPGHCCGFGFCQPC